MKVTPLEFAVQNATVECNASQSRNGEWGIGNGDSDERFTKVTRSLYKIPPQLWNGNGG